MRMRSNRLADAIGDTLNALRAMGDNPDARQVVTDDLYRLQRSARRMPDTPDPIRDELAQAVVAMQVENRPDAAAECLEHALRFT